MNQERLLKVSSWVGWILIVGLSCTVAWLWYRLDQQVDQQASEIARIQAYSQRLVQRLRDDNAQDQTRLENRWGNHLMPLLRQHHRLLQSIPDVREPIPPLPEWLKEQP